MFRGLHFKPLEAKMGSKPDELMGQELTNVFPSQISLPWYYSGDWDCVWPEETGLEPAGAHTHMDKGGAPEALTWAKTSHLGPLVPGK